MLKQSQKNSQSLCVTLLLLNNFILIGNSGYDRVSMLTVAVIWGYVN
jgi:hypothetical protein